MQISAAILTGGENSRMNGELKALLNIEKISIIARQFALLQEIFDNIFICGKETEYNLPIKAYEDEFKGSGPVSGIYSALKNSTTDYVFIFSCDMPFLNRELIEKMINEAKTGNYDAIIPSHNDGIEPLHGIYSKKLLQKIENQLNDKDFRIRKIYEGINIKYFNVYLPIEPEIAFFNINSPADLTRAINYERRKDTYDDRRNQ